MFDVECGSTNRKVKKMICASNWNVCRFVCCVIQGAWRSNIHLPKHGPRYIIGKELRWTVVVGSHVSDSPNDYII